MPSDQNRSSAENALNDLLPGAREALPAKATGDWSRDEVDLAVDVYFEMLNLELDRVSFVKAAYERRLAHEIGRSRKAASFKFSNISTALYELGSVFVDGYKPLPNLQGLLRERVAARYEADSGLRQAMLRAVEAMPESEVELSEPTSPPRVDIAWTALGGIRQGHHRDYLELEASNHALGRAGELAALRWERQRLATAGRADLAHKVAHVAVDEGDGLGYDIRSFHVTGAERFIEVKTTRYAAATPFFVTSNEVEVSREFGEQFTLFRIFKHGLVDRVTTSSTGRWKIQRRYERLSTGACQKRRPRSSLPDQALTCCRLQTVPLSAVGRPGRKRTILRVRGSSCQLTVVVRHIGDAVVVEGLSTPSSRVWLRRISYGTL